MRSNAYCGNLLWQSSLTLLAPRTVTQGRGSFTMIFKQYEAVPKNIAAEVVEKRIKEGKVRPMAD